MAASELFTKYLWLIQLMVQSYPKGLTLREITAKWEKRWNAPYPRRTFNFHRTNIEDYFGIKIQCNRSTGRYFIDVNENLSASDPLLSWMLQTFTTINLLNYRESDFEGRISVENTPTGHVWLSTILEAMKEGRMMRITYRKYGSTSEPEKFDVKPYGIKESDKRWYLVAFCVQRGSVRVYALDRIQSCEVGEDTFTIEEGFSLDDLFKGSYGVYLSGGEEPVEIIIKATPRESEYIRDLPIHSSQEQIGDCVFRYRLIPNDSFVMNLCSRGDRIEVITPSALRQRVLSEHLKAMEVYLSKFSGLGPLSSPPAPK